MTSWQMPVCGLRSVSGHAAPLAKEILLAKPALILSIVNTFKNSIDVGSKSVITTQPRILAFGKKSPKAWTRSQIFSGLPLSLWRRDRLGGARQVIYRAATLGRQNLSYGHIESSPHFWGDLCKNRIRYCRNFTYGIIDTLQACPWMPYHDPERPHVNYWFASSDGKNVNSFLRLLSEKNQDVLEARGGACIVYTHFGLGFVEGGALNARFRLLIDRLKRKNGWFVPVNTLLDYLLLQRTDSAITAQQRRDMEWRWLCRKLLKGTS
jgi:hypothetical protein